MKLTAFVAAVLLGTTAMAQSAEAPKPTWTFALKGFVSMSAAYQEGTFGASEGQQSLWATTPLDGKDKSSLTFDVRQTRLNFSVKGPQVLFGATPSAVVELDFFQGFGGGNGGDVSLLNRLRTAYSELDWGGHKIQAGQQNDLIFAMAPTSLSHLAFPLGYMTGNIGWRRPGVFGYHTFKLEGVTLEGAWEVGRSQWADSGACVAGNNNVPPPYDATGITTTSGSNVCSGIGATGAGTAGGINLGEATSGPAVEARITATFGKLGNVWVAGHYNNVDLSGYGRSNPAGVLYQGTVDKRSLTVQAYNAGAKFNFALPNDMGVSVAATGFMGNNTYPLISNLSLGSSPTVSGSAAKGLSQANYGKYQIGFNGEDIPSWGYWAQVGINLTKQFSLWGMYGQQQVDEKKLVRSFGTNAASSAGTAFQNTTTNVIAMYRDGGYGLSLEWIDFATKYGTFSNFTAGSTEPGTKFTAKHDRHSDQVMLTATYFF